MRVREFLCMSGLPLEQKRARCQFLMRCLVLHTAFLLSVMVYFVYCNPEYSYTYTYLRRRYGLDEGKPLFPQYMKLPSSPDAIQQEHDDEQQRQQR